jgi:hypothetical protein
MFPPPSPCLNVASPCLHISGIPQTELEKMAISVSLLQMEKANFCLFSENKNRKQNFVFLAGNDEWKLTMAVSVNIAIYASKIFKKIFSTKNCLFCKG